MRKSLPVLVLLLFLSGCGQSPKTYQPNSGTNSASNSGTGSSNSGTGSSNSGTGSSSGAGSSNSATSYQSDSGTVTSLNAVTGYLQLGGNFVSPDAMGGGCNYGECPAWQFNSYALSYVLPDGTTADFTNFTGTANFMDQSDVKVSGTASGNDSTGTAVQVSVSWAWAASCKSGRDGGCTKRFISGTLTVTK